MPRDWSPLRPVPGRLWGDPSPVPPRVFTLDPTVDMVTDPLQHVNGMSAEASFDYGMGLLELHPPHLTNGPLLMQMRRLGLVPGVSFASLDRQVKDALADAPARGLQTLKEALPRLARVVDGWQMNVDTMGVYGNF
jgi:hypothetical protein